MILTKKRIRRCAGWSAPVLFTNPRRQVLSRYEPLDVSLTCYRILSGSLYSIDDTKTDFLYYSEISLIWLTSLPTGIDCLPMLPMSSLSWFLEKAFQVCLPSSCKVSKVAKIRNRYNQVPHLTQDINGKVTNSQKTPQTRAKRSALSQQVTTKHI